MPLDVSKSLIAVNLKLSMKLITTAYKIASSGNFTNKKDLYFMEVIVLFSLNFIFINVFP